MSPQQIRISQVPSDRVQFTRALRLISPMSLQQARELATHLDRFRRSDAVLARRECPIQVGRFPVNERVT